MEKLPKEIFFGDTFTGTLKRAVRGGGRIFIISDFPDKHMQLEVRTLMGFLDLPCLSYKELDEGDGKRYRFEIVRDEERAIICRALERVSCAGLNYKTPDKEKLRQELEYKVGQERIVVPSRTEFHFGYGVPRAFFFEPYFPSMTGFIYFNKDMIVKSFVGKRVLVKVNKIEQTKENRYNVNTEFLSRL